MSIKDSFYIKQIDFKTAERVVERCHYAHRKASCVYSFGLFNNENHRLVGVIIYGIPASDFVCKCICGESEKRNVYELTRLYVDDGLPKNCESYLISNTIKLLDREIIISYSDTQYGHIGIVYQATNFIYTGLSLPHKDPVSNNRHNRHNKNRLSDGFVIRSPKHRYIYFNANKRRKKELIKKLKLPILPYPKSNRNVPKTSFENISDMKGGYFNGSKV